MPLSALYGNPFIQLFVTVSHNWASIGYESIYLSLISR